MSWKKSDVLMDTIKHYSNFPATGVSLRQMVQFGERPSTGEYALEDSLYSNGQTSPNNGYRHALPSVAVPVRRASYPPGPSSTGIG